MTAEKIKEYEDACRLIMKSCLAGVNDPQTLNALHTIMGYADLLQSKIVPPSPTEQELRQEIERLKELVEDAYVAGRNDEKNKSEMMGWQQFKTDNNL